MPEALSSSTDSLRVPCAADVLPLPCVTASPPLPRCPSACALPELDGHEIRVGSRSSEPRASPTSSHKSYRGPSAPDDSDSAFDSAGKASRGGRPTVLSTPPRGPGSKSRRSKKGDGAASGPDDSEALSESAARTECGTAVGEAATPYMVVADAFKRDKDANRARKKKLKRIKSAMSSLLLLHPWLEPADPKGERRGVDAWGVGDGLLVLAGFCCC